MVVPTSSTEFNRVMRFNTYVLSTQQVWKIEANNSQDVVESVHNRLSWQSNVIWSYNAPIRVGHSLPTPKINSLSTPETDSLPTPLYVHQRHTNCNNQKKISRTININNTKTLQTTTTSSISSPFTSPPT